MTFLAIGLDCDPTMVHFLRYCRRGEIAVEAINLREVAAKGTWKLSVPPAADDFIQAGQKTWVMRDFRAVYNRPIDLTWQHADHALANRWSGLMTALFAWLQCADTLIVNRPIAGAHNSSKPLHEQLIRRTGLLVPPSLASMDTTSLLAFARAKPSVIKALGGARGDTIRVTEEMLERYPSPAAPLYIQEYIPGADIRAHVVHDQVHSVRVDSTAVDYRAAAANPRFSPWTLPPDIGTALVAAGRSFGLELSGWDLKLDSGGTYWCLEANPQPGYSMYDRHLDFQISRSLADLLRRASA
ncbi:MAG TPA: hypothetical protein VI365_16215 [Trebonia sp.]